MDVPEYHSQRLLAESMDQNLLIWLLGINHTSPGGAPSMNAETAATLFDVMTKERGLTITAKAALVLPMAQIRGRGELVEEERLLRFLIR